MHWSFGKYINSSSSDRLTLFICQENVCLTPILSNHICLSVVLASTDGSGKGIGSVGISNNHTHVSSRQPCTLEWSRSALCVLPTVPLNSKEISTQESRFTNLIRKLWNETAWQWSAREAGAAASSAKTPAVSPAVTLHHGHKHPWIAKGNCDLG